MTEEEIPVPVQLKRWSKSGLIEEARVPDQNIFQTEEFDRDDTGELLIEDCVRRKEHLEDKMMTLKFALEAYDRDHREAIKQRLDEIQDRLQTLEESSLKSGKGDSID